MDAKRRLGLRPKADGNCPHVIAAHPSDRAEFADGVDHAAELVVHQQY
jgi:hypothetical protein